MTHGSRKKAEITCLSRHSPHHHLCHPPLPSRPPFPLPSALPMTFASSTSHMTTASVPAIVIATCMEFLHHSLHSITPVTTTVSTIKSLPTPTPHAQNHSTSVIATVPLPSAPPHPQCHCQQHAQHLPLPFATHLQLHSSSCTWPSPHIAFDHSPDPSIYRSLALVLASSWSSPST